MNNISKDVRNILDSDIEINIKTVAHEFETIFSNSKQVEHIKNNLSENMEIYKLINSFHRNHPAMEDSTLKTLLMSDPTFKQTYRGLYTGRYGV